MKAPPPKPKLDKVFDCPFCAHGNCVEVKMNRQEKVGQLKCRICNVDYTKRIEYLDEPVDVYSDWIDQCERVDVNIADNEGK